MIRTRCFVLLFCTLMMAYLPVASAWAQNGYRYSYGEDFFGARGFGVSGSLYGLGYVPVPPYYALHPPVYYTGPVGRSYGYSPFAYSGDTPTPEFVRPQPVEIINPFVKPQEKKEAPAKKTAETTPNKVTAAPLTILNPFAGQPVPGPALVSTESDGK